VTRPATSHSQESPRDDVVAQLRAEMSARWRAGDRVPVDHVLAGHPGLSDEDRLVLIVGEVLLRWERGEAPTPEEYAARFPGQAGWDADTGPSVRRSRTTGR
jgi:hypothetical protein